MTTAIRMPSWCAASQAQQSGLNVLLTRCWGVQMQRAHECETHTGAAEADAGAADGAEVRFILRCTGIGTVAPLSTGNAQEVDPLEAFMAEINQEAKAEPAKARPEQAGLELEEDDNMTSFLEVLLSSTCCSSILH